ncbi:4'-phosphopantetheinyl transferase superfamily protein [Aliiglaciecola sp. 3_MG-2023]|uniref:4'-phosphopantetheinyl transferase family protein n=1 Tax=Aliiglaciecola sp. 3_MG-2023 TaxID=3062644 RepID=UPI0026E36907|nr:4'-phosphopantetheinyl transferase superfamily protein [Aliiglaciecola sp. 3_MG-2023]MDO6695062.1 4'-phosphopantetheinyl transferase superfamily protein [Aliiglaciecola sp. 3_MG-2023]
MQINFKKDVDFQLWETRVENQQQDIESTVLQYLSPSEYIRLNNLSHTKKQREYLYSRALIRSAFSQVFDVPLDYWSIVDSANTLPVVTNLPVSLNYSLSHSNNVINFAVSHVPVGIDLEQYKARKNLLQMAKLFMTKTEYLHLQRLKEMEKQSYFYRIWCAKEAFFKSLDADSQKSFSPINISIENNEMHHLDLIDHSDALFARIIILRKN